MPNEVTSLLNALNSYITCPVCKVTDDIEIVLTCGHVICKNCKTKRTKCSVCYSELSATRSHSPSIKFIEELCKELLKVSTGEIKSVELEHNVGNSIVTPNVKEDKPTRNDSGTSGNEKIKKKINFGIIENVEISNDVVKVINEVNRFRNKDKFRKNRNHKKGLIFYKNYCKHKEERKVYRKILKGFGIVGIDKQIKKVKSKHDFVSMKKELNGQLNTIISRLNYQCPNNSNLENTKFNNSLKMNTDSNCSDSEKNIQMNYGTSMNFGGSKDGFGIIKCDLKRNGFNLINNSSGLKRKNVDSGIEEGPHSKAFVRKITIVDDCLINFDKKLGGIVDETEIIQRYLNPPMEGPGKEETNDKIKSPCNNLCATQNNFLSKKPEFPNEGPHVTNKTIIDDTTCGRLSKSEIKNIVSDFMEEISPSSEECGLQSDIMVDMLHNVSNEIVVVGNNLCTTEKNTEICNNLINASSYSVSSSKNHSVNNCSPYKQSDDKTHSITIKIETESNGDNGVIVVSDSDDDDVEVVKKYSDLESSRGKADRTDVNSEEDISIRNCRIVLDDLSPLMLQSPDNNVQMGNEESLENSDVKKSLIMDSNATNGKNESSNEENMVIEDQKSISENNLNLMPTLSKVSLEQKEDKCEVLNTFEGFTEDDILILTVKLALFKMNGCKYSKNLSSSSLYSLDGKQILIKDVSHDEDYPDSPCCPNKISKSLVTSSVQTENDLLTVTPSPSTSKIRPVSLVKLRGFEIENEKFMQNDVLDIRKPLTPNTPLGKESVVSSLSQNSPVLKATPVSRRQLSFMSPTFENKFQYQDDGASTSDVKATSSVPNSSLNDDWQVLHYRMQHMIPSNPEDALHSEFEHSGISPTRLTFTTCGLNSKETALVTKLAQMTKSCLTKDFTHNTTHLVIGATGRGRLEYYLAIAYRAFIVTMDWVTLCLALNKILPVTGFIPTEDEGPLKCLEPSSLPFVGFHVFSKILPTSSSYPIAEITKTLLSLGGARVLPNLDAFHTLQDGNYPRFFIYNSKSVLTQPVLDKCASLHILPIQFMWVYESIGAFRAIPVMDFLDIGIHSRTLIRDYKIPDQLACSRYPRLEGEFHPQILDERYQRSL
ncbi:unnamed protein product [Nezara viridula]|uniref:RING-type E3 ubiquitin transferase BRCA1 n=1 Tax=Nezara viridula TaxID=85310 RepID=A0A9P0HI73_NEZVI|nr:unnamed protein product [Nezara viridula]